MKFEWDPAKAAKNDAKHGVGFAEAQTAFTDPNALVFPDEKHVEEEERFLLLGVSTALRVLVVVHCLRGDGDVVRIISARRADARERGVYLRSLP